MNTIQIPKSYPESVVRKALYWASSCGQWTLDEDKNHWIVRVSDGVVDFETTLHRHLNDFLLRYQLDERTGRLRQVVVESALRGILKRVNG